MRHHFAREPHAHSLRHSRSLRRSRSMLQLSSGLNACRFASVYADGRRRALESVPAFWKWVGCATMGTLVGTLVGIGECECWGGGGEESGVGVQRVLASVSEGHVWRRLASLGPIWIVAPTNKTV
jgi:hypothetical protein